MHKKVLGLMDFVVLLLVAVGIFFYWHVHSKVAQLTAKSPSPKFVAPAREIPPDIANRIREAQLERESLLQHFGKEKMPKFYGKVIDDTGTAIAGARIMVSPVRAGSLTPITSDSEGHFSLSGIEPASSVFVSKFGYRPAIAANGEFQYAAEAKNPNYAHPDTPAVFTLKRM